MIRAGFQSDGLSKRHKANRERKILCTQEEAMHPQTETKKDHDSPPTPFWCLGEGSQALLLLTADLHTTALHRLVLHTQGGAATHFA